MRSALLAADLVLSPVQPSPFDGWASAEMLALLREARIYRPELAARFVLNRCGARTVLARETAQTPADHVPPLLTATMARKSLPWGSSVPLRVDLGGRRFITTNTNPRQHNNHNNK